MALAKRAGNARSIAMTLSQAAARFGSERQKPSFSVFMIASNRDAIPFVRTPTTRRQDPTVGQDAETYARPSATPMRTTPVTVIAMIVFKSKWRFGLPRPAGGGWLGRSADGGASVMR